MNLQNRNRLIDLESKLIVTKEEGWEEGIVREFGIDMYTPLYLQWITNKDLLYSKGSSAQCYGAAWMGGSLGENGYMYIYGWVALLCTSNYHNIVNRLYPNTKLKTLKKVSSSLLTWARTSHPEQVHKCNNSRVKNRHSILIIQKGLLKYLLNNVREQVFLFSLVTIITIINTIIITILSLLSFAQLPSTSWFRRYPLPISCKSRVPYSPGGWKVLLAYGHTWGMADNFYEKWHILEYTPGDPSLVNQKWANEKATDINVSL